MSQVEGTTEEPTAEAIANDQSSDAPAQAGRFSYAWVWVPTLYFAEGIPYLIVMSLAGDMYVLLGIENDRMARATSLLYLPWVIKPLWSPLVSEFGRARWWIVGTQFLIAATLVWIACALGAPSFFTLTLAGFWLLAIASATHDIAADGFYLNALPKDEQAWFSGIRSVFYRLAMFFVSAALLAVAGRLGDSMPAQQAWAWTLVGAGALFGLLAAYHQIALPRPRRSEDRPAGDRVAIGERLSESLTSFFAKPGVGLGISYLLAYRLGESQLAKLAKPFLFADREAGGLALSEGAVATIYGGFGVAMLIVGGVAGGAVTAKLGLKRLIVPMALAINLPNALYALLAYGLPTSYSTIGFAVGLEQLGYGFGFAGYLIYMMRLSEGSHAVAHYSLCTGFMALGMMIPGFVAGDIQMRMGYFGFFVWVVVASLPSIAMAMIIQRRLPHDA